MPDDHQPVQFMFSTYFMNENGMGVCEHLGNQLTSVVKASNVNLGNNWSSYVKNISNMRIDGGEDCNIRTLPYDEKVRVQFKNMKLSFFAADVRSEVGGKVFFDGEAEMELSGFDATFILSFNTQENTDAYVGMKHIPGLLIEHIDFQGP